MHCDELAHAHELTFSCYHRYPFLRAERTCRWLVDAINQGRSKWSFAVWAYVLMPEHVHLIVWCGPRSPKVQTILASIKQPVGRKAFDYLEANAPAWLPRLT